MGQLGHCIAELRKALSFAVAAGCEEQDDGKDEMYDWRLFTRQQDGGEGHIVVRSKSE